MDPVAGIGVGIGWIGAEIRTAVGGMIVTTEEDDRMAVGAVATGATTN